MANPWREAMRVNVADDPNQTWYCAPTITQIAAWADEVERRLAALEAQRGLEDPYLPQPLRKSDVLWLRKNEPPAAAILREQHYREALESAAKMLEGLQPQLGWTSLPLDQTANMVRAHRVEEKP